MRNRRNQKGFTIIQVLVGAFIAAIVALGVAQMMVNSRITTRRINLLNLLREQKLRIEYLLRDQTAFDQTLNGTLNSAPIFTALKTSALATELSYTNQATKIVIYDSAGVPVYDMLPPIAVSMPATANGITEKGNPCTSFNPNPGAGNDNCPISYRITMGADCLGPATTCFDPQLKIVARLIYNPSTSQYSTLNQFRNLIPASGTNTDSIADTQIDNRYDAVVKRTASSISRGFKLTAYYDSTGGGAGACTGAFAVHPRAAAGNWTVDYDPHNLVSASLGTFNFKETGYYNCSLWEVAYGVNGFTYRIYNVTTASAKGTGNGIALPNAEVIGRLDTSFLVSPTTDVYRADVKCDIPVGITDLGPPHSAAIGTSYPVMSVQCSKVDNAF